MVRASRSTAGATRLPIVAGAGRERAVTGDLTSCIFEGPELHSVHQVLPGTARVSYNRHPTTHYLFPHTLGTNEDRNGTNRAMIEELQTLFRNEGLTESAVQDIDALPARQSVIGKVLERRKVRVGVVNAVVVQRL